jgi:hypothetical protein
MRLVDKLQTSGFDIPGERPKVHCKAFEDNSGALEIATTRKMKPQTKHLNIEYHHFREAVNNKQVSIWSIDTLEQLADTFTKPLGEELFFKFWSAFIGC